MGNELQTVKQDSQVSAETMEKVIAQGDLKDLTPKQRVEYYRSVCDSLGLNWSTKPFEYITLNGKLTLYARKDATEQLRRTQHVSIIRLERERLDGIYVVTATAQTVGGRQDSSIGAVSIEGLKGDALANAMMKAETKAKRRVTLSICGLGWTDESEIETIPNGKPAMVNLNTGEIIDTAKMADGMKALEEMKPEVKPVTLQNDKNAWTRTTGQLDKIAEAYALTNATVLEALGVSKLEDYQGSKADAKNDIEQWLAENVTEIEPEPSQLTM